MSKKDCQTVPASAAPSPLASVGGDGAENVLLIHPAVYDTRLPWERWQLL